MLVKYIILYTTIELLETKRHWGIVYVSRFLGKMFLYLIHLLYLFYIKLFSQSETIFTNDEHEILSGFHQFSINESI